LHLGVHRVSASTLASCMQVLTTAPSPPHRYANKFKSLLLCGSVVLYIREGMRHKARLIVSDGL
jgi:hypothetical protein